jgi:predicted transposase/invertase (TIGR01784 family)
MEEEYKMAYVTSWERMGVEKGIEQGIGIGVEKGILTTAERMLKGNLPIERISEFTGLSTQQIKKIAKESTEPKQ